MRRAGWAGPPEVSSSRGRRERARGRPRRKEPQSAREAWRGGGPLRVPAQGPGRRRRRAASPGRHGGGGAASSRRGSLQTAEPWLRSVMQPWGRPAARPASPPGEPALRGCAASRRSKAGHCGPGPYAEAGRPAGCRWRARGKDPRPAWGEGRRTPRVPGLPAAVSVSDAVSLALEDRARAHRGAAPAAVVMMVVVMRLRGLRGVQQRRRGLQV